MKAFAGEGGATHTYCMPATNVYRHFKTCITENSLSGFSDKHYVKENTLLQSLYDLFILSKALLHIISIILSNHDTVS